MAPIADTTVKSPKPTKNLITYTPYVSEGNRLMGEKYIFFIPMSIET